MTVKKHSVRRRPEYRRRRLTVGGTTLVIVAATTVFALRGGHSASRTKAALAQSSTLDRGGAKAATERATTSTVATTTTVPPPYVPPAIVPKIAAAPAGEGQWTAADTWVGGPPLVLTTTFHPDASVPSVAVYAAWIRTAGSHLALYPGYKGPGPITLDHGPEMVPAAARSALIATFNSGFYEADAPGGFYTHGNLYFKMLDGSATLVAYANGTVDIVDWNQGPAPPPGIVMARQNLALLVDNGAATPSASLPSKWGVTLHGAGAVWRTGLGVDSRGNLIYVAAPQQTAASLAEILVTLGAVRGMQLDINPEWPIFVTYGAAGAAAPKLFVPNPNQIANRFLYPSTKDFFAVFGGAIPSQLPW